MAYQATQEIDREIAQLLFIPVHKNESAQTANPYLSHIAHSHYIKPVMNPD